MTATPGPAGPLELGTLAPGARMGHHETMTTSDQPAELRAVAEASRKAAESRAELRQAIVTASLRGFSQAEIAAAAGFTRQWIGRVVQEWRAAKGLEQGSKAS